ncbi:hypothetical protein CVT24_000558 [Panaeolus cyanescens]|uniref:PEBP-like protein n=1 Tax=Panaeolus cyanescens TaxID=181874 RepID=A0A409VXE4_9AGAR|nr:hypothetical protein CVT24_000558 [Panaeolus cyanescens]
MFSLKRLPSVIPKRPWVNSVRNNATLEVASSKDASPTPPVDASRLAQSKPASGSPFRKKRPPKRPNITLETPREWNRPLAAGVVPAYDQALHYLKEDSERLKRELRVIRKDVHEKQTEYNVLKKKLLALSEDKVAERTELKDKLRNVDEALESLLQKANIVEIQTDKSKASHRHLLEQKWRKDGDLDLLMERVHQMNVVPDMLPSIHPSFHLRVVAQARPSEIEASNKLHKEVEPGVFLEVKQTIQPPRLFANVYHTDTRLYTMLLVDLDVPNPEEESFTTYLHWMKPNIPLSATSPERISDLNTHTQYVPPHPQNGSPYHRYVTILLPQPPLEGSEYTLSAASRADGPTSAHLDIPIVPDEQRLGFNVRDFVEKWNLDGSKGGGLHMWRAVWDDSVSEIYRDILKKPEPYFGRPQKGDPYAHLKTQKKYIL